MSEQERIAELEAEVARCHANHLEPFACHCQAEGGWACEDFKRRVELEAENERLSGILNIVSRNVPMVKTPFNTEWHDAIDALRKSKDALARIEGNDG